MESGADMDKTADQGTSPVMIASLKGHLEVVNCLVEAGADKDKASRFGAMRIYVASQAGHVDVVK